MTDHVPAAAPSLSSFDRRSFLATLAAAGAMTAAVEVPAIAAEHPDQAIFDLEALHGASEARQHEFDRQVDEAFKLYTAPDIPEALFRREREPIHVVSCSSPLTSIAIGGEKRFYFEGGVADLSHGAQQYANFSDAYPQGRFFSEAARARIGEIKEAHRAWQAEVRAAEDAAGVTGPRAAGDAESVIMDGVIFDVMRTSTTTAEGLSAKARFATEIFLGDLKFIETELMPRLLSKIDEGNNLRTAFALSMIIDAVKLGAAPRRHPPARWWRHERDDPFLQAAPRRQAHRQTRNG